MATGSSDPMIAVNRALWDEWTAVHQSSELYDVAGFKAGHDTLRPLEAGELGDVQGKTLLHLMCHFGLDTLSLARRGARVTGADFSPEAVAKARSLAAELGMEARFVAANIYDLPAQLDERFDIVFTSWGVLAWLGDLPAWGRLIAHFLKPGGCFYMAEIHPFASILELRGDGRLMVDGAYLSDGAAQRYDVPSSYADTATQCRHTISYQWDHSLSDVVMALAEAGLALEHLREWPFSVYQRWLGLEQAADGWWYLPGRRDMPLSFSLRARKPA
jgi:2-polyprenyl-3-methyl-5-hydroxy-6-metoxy-1,4-benzoquinol methylase